MAGSVNKVILIGNLGADPEVRTTPSGQQVATLSLATSRNYKDREGNRREETEWHRVVVWNQLAELAQRYLAKGRKVYIEGRLQTRSWDDQQSGQKKYTTEIIADQMTFLDSGQSGGQGAQQGGGGYGQQRGGDGGGGGYGGGAPSGGGGGGYGQQRGDAGRGGGPSQQPAQSGPQGGAPPGADPGFYDDDDIPF